MAGTGIWYIQCSARLLDFSERARTLEEPFLKFLLKWDAVCVLFSGKHKSDCTQTHRHTDTPYWSSCFRCFSFCRPNSILRLRFNHFATECSWDHLYVYDGDSIYSPLLAAFRYRMAFLCGCQFLLMLASLLGAGRCPWCCPLFL